MNKKKLSEKYRPDCFEKVIGQDKAIQKIKRSLRYGFSTHFWIEGNSGQGKTTLARIIASENCSKDCIIELVKPSLVYQDLVDIKEKIKDIDRFQAWNGGRVENICFIINEAHKFSSRIVTAFLDLLEEVRDGVVFIFTTTQKFNKGLFDGIDDARPLVDRCCLVSLTSQGLNKTFTKYIIAIAKKEGILDESRINLEKYVSKMVENANNSLRKCFSLIQSGYLEAQI